MFHLYPGLRPGALSALRQACVNNERLSACAATRRLQGFMLHHSSALVHDINNYVQLVGLARNCY